MTLSVYIRFMKDKTSDEDHAPKGSSESEKVFDINQVRGFVKRDLGVAITLLEAMYKDPATCDAIADYLHGRYMNAKHADDLRRQTKIPV